MKNIYIIATAAAKNIRSEQSLLNALSKENYEVREIHELPRIEKNEIAIADIEIAGEIKKRFEDEMKTVKLVVLVCSEEILQSRLQGFSPEYYKKRVLASEHMAIAHGDYSVDSDDLEVAAELILHYIATQEI